jgi:hypothetical protein
MSDHRHFWTFAARRSDVRPEGGWDLSGEANFSETGLFDRDHAPLMALYGLSALLKIYGGRLALLRDAAGRHRFIRRPVSEARHLDSYLLTDGLDVATITADVADFTKELTRFRQGVPEYIEYHGDLSAGRDNREPVEFVPLLCGFLKDSAARLAADTANTDGNLRASAELRQAIANTRLQRIVVMFTIAALLVAVLSLAIAVLTLIRG